MSVVENSNIGTGNINVVGCVKFFDKNAGFGFISVLKTDVFPQFSEKDIFVHYSGINIENKQYKYLLKGEYVEFKIVPSTKPSTTNTENLIDNEKYNAVDIKGIQGGKLMCETNFSEYIPKINRTPNYSGPPPKYAGGPPANYYGNSSNMDVDIVGRPPVTRTPGQVGGRGQYVQRVKAR